MANVKKEDRVQDVDIKRLNHLGLGLKAIATHLGCHPATVTLRLQAMKLRPVDTRRSFMEGVFAGLTRDEQDWLSHNLYNQDIGVKQFVSALVHEAYMAAAKETPIVSAPAVDGLQGGIPSQERKDSPVAPESSVPPAKKKLKFK